jgi:hypothetical protein
VNASSTHRRELGVEDAWGAVESLRLVGWLSCVRAVAVQHCVRWAVAPWDAPVRSYCCSSSEQNTYKVGGRRQAVCTCVCVYVCTCGWVCGVGVGVGVWCGCGCGCGCGCFCVWPSNFGELGSQINLSCSLCQGGRVGTPEPKFGVKIRIEKIRAVFPTVRTSRSNHSPHTHTKHVLSQDHELEHSPHFIPSLI